MGFARRLSAVLLGVVCSVTGPSASAEGRAYEPYSDIERGTEGVAPVALTIENGAGGPIRCTASLAHWYSEDLGTIRPGAAIATTLWYDPVTGELSLLNAIEDRMPVEAIWCGRAGQAYETRTRVSLPFTIDASPEALRRQCADARDGGLSCVDPGS